MPPASMRIERIHRDHRSLFGAFDCGVSQLNEYLRRFALRHDERDGIANTWLLLDHEEGRLVGFFSLTASSLCRSDADAIPSLARLPRYPVPAFLLARFAVDSEAQGAGVGSALFAEVVRRVLAAAREGGAARALLADAKNDAALRFYERWGMQAVGDDWPRRVVLDLHDVRRLL